MVKSATRVMQILELVGRNRDGLKHLDIAKALNIPKGSLTFLLSDLVGGEFLTINNNNKRYRIGPKILSLAGRYLADLDIIKASQPFIRKIIAATNESCGLSVRMGFKVMIVWREHTQEPLKWDLKIGDLYPMHASSHGKAILAFLDPDEIQQFLSSPDFIPITDKTITDAEVLLDQLHEIKNGAIAYSREENFEGITSMGVPIFNNLGQAIASFGIPVPSQRFDKEKEKVIGEALKSSAESLSRQLGHFIKR